MMSDKLEADVLERVQRLVPIAERLGHHDGATRARVGAARRERRIGDRRRLAAGAGARQRLRLRASSSTRRHSRRSTGRSSRLGAVARRKLRPQNEVVERCRTLSEELRAALGRLPSDDPGRRRRRLARRGPRDAALGAPARGAPALRPAVRPGRAGRGVARGGTPAGCRRDRARARVGAALALAGAHDRPAGRPGTSSCPSGTRASTS